MDGTLAHRADTADAAAASDAAPADQIVRMATTTNTTTAFPVPEHDVALFVVEALPLVVPKPGGPDAPRQHFAAAENPPGSHLTRVRFAAPVAHRALDGGDQARIPVANAQLLPLAVRQAGGTARDKQLELGLGLVTELGGGGGIVAQPLRGRRDVDLVHLSLAAASRVGRWTEIPFVGSGRVSRFLCFFFWSWRVAKVRRTPRR